MKTSPLTALWKLLCSLKLAIVLASLVTLLGMAGSLVMHAHPELFGNLDRVTLGDWLKTSAQSAPRLTWWLWLAGLLLILFGVNTLCCFLDWLWTIRHRWRKCGEYLIHAGFVLLLVAYLWGSLAGFRHDRLRIFPGDSFAIPEQPGVELRLTGFEPRLDERGMPLDMLNQLQLWRDGRQLLSTEARINHPLTWRGLVVVPTSFGQDVQGFRCFQPGRGMLEMSAGQRHTFPGEVELLVEDFLPDVRRTSDGQVVAAGRQLANPAFLLEVRRGGQSLWRGWHLLRESPPFALVANGIRYRPVEPLVNTFSVLTVNYDPGASLALAGGGLMLVGVVLATVSFYRKRRRNEHPDIP